MSGIEQWLVEHGGAIATGLLIIGAVVAFQRWALPKLRQVGHLIDDLAGEPARPGVEARPGLMERMKSVEDYAASLLERVLQRLDQLEHRMDKVERALLEYKDAANEASRDKAITWQTVDDAIHADPPPTTPSN